MPESNPAVLMATEIKLVEVLVVVNVPSVRTVYSARFAAGCVWLTLRIINRRERWAKWTLLWLIVALVVYGLLQGCFRDQPHIPGRPA